MQKPNQFLLLKERRFWPIFCTQFLGAFNDNVCKSATVVLIALSILHTSSLNPALLINLAAGLFILPFFLFSALAGQIADKYEKSFLIRCLKLFEIALMFFAAFAFLVHSLSLQMISLFLLGVQATFFGPLKYSILPQQLHPHELLGGNGLIETATFVAILLGTVFGGMIIAIPHYGEELISIALISVAILGWLSSLAIMPAAAAAPQLTIHLNFFTQTIKNIKFASKRKIVLLAILGISWFWFYGAVYLAQIPSFAIEIIGGDQHLVTFFMVIFSIGVSFGAFICEKMFGGRVEPGIIPLAALGLSLFGIDLFFATHGYHLIPNTTVINFIANKHNWRILVDMTFIGIFGALYTVPLYTIMQLRSNPSHRSRIVAANNILNAIFMVVAAILGAALLAFKVTIPQLFLIINLMNLVVVVYTYIRLPAFVMRILAVIVLRLLYRFQVVGLENVPTKGPAILICNHVSYLDPIILYIIARRPMRFLMDHKIYQTPGINYFFHISDSIPITTRKENPELLERAFDKAATALTHGQLVGLFPEGKITYTGDINEFRLGVEHIVARTPVPVVPMALQGLWGSWLSRDKNRFFYLFRRVRPRIKLIIGKPIPPAEVTAAKLEKIVREMRGDKK